MFIQRLGGAICFVLATLTAYPCTPALAIVKEEVEDPVERCKRRCEEAWERENDRCRTLRTRKQREKCWRENNERRAKCVRDCED